MIPETLIVDLAVAEELSFRIFAALFLGLLVGLERSITHKQIGFRTFSLVCLGSCAFTLVSVYGFGNEADASRVAAQIVTGIGFLGAGAIIHTGLVTRGLTTAATLWVAAAIGMACATGMIILASIVTVLSILLLSIMKPVKKKLDSIIEQGEEKNKSGTNGDKISD